MSKPTFTICNKFQKQNLLYEDLLTPQILSDVCRRITGQEDYMVHFVDKTNVGRLAVLEHDGVQSYITFSEINPGAGRNHNFQSIGSALNIYINSSSNKGYLYFYFLPMEGNYQTDYFLFMYRLMLTSKIKFLNAEEYLRNTLVPFVSVEDVLLTRNEMRKRKENNKSSYMTIDDNGVLQIFAKTYGANKYESTLFGMALSHLTPGFIEMHQICEQNLKTLPKSSLAALNVVSNGRIKIIPTDIRMEIAHLETPDGLRSPHYIYNLLANRGPKKCALCKCDIPEIIHGAHIWGVSQIKNTSHLTINEKYEYATDGENGLWLCENHHKMFDENIITFSHSGKVEVRNNLCSSQKEFIDITTTYKHLPQSYLTRDFLFYLDKRYVA